MTRFSRQDVVRILHLGPRELAVWERANLIPVRPDYTFNQLGELRTLRDLRARRISTRKIRSAMDAMHRLFGVCCTLAEASPAGVGDRVRFRHGGSVVEPLTQQLAFDFAPGVRDQPLELSSSAAAVQGRRTIEVQELFLQSVRLEEEGRLEEAVTSYLAILDLRPQHAPTLINLGTIHYNRREFAEAERLYRSATDADPQYALAFFDLGNVLDEMGRLAEATQAYGRAVALVPHYADAHYNLALAHERQGQRRRALPHWLTYVRLDPVGPWSAHARNQARRTLNAEKLSIVSRRGRLVQAG